jgi:hypothetical protein
MLDGCNNKFKMISDLNAWEVVEKFTSVVVVVVEECVVDVMEVIGDSISVCVGLKPVNRLNVLLSVETDSSFVDCSISLLIMDAAMGNELDALLSDDILAEARLPLVLLLPWLLWFGMIDLSLILGRCGYLKVIQEWNMSISYFQSSLSDRNKL